MKENSGMWPEFTIHHDGSGRLIVMKEISIKIFHVLMIDFTPMPDEHVKQSISYRYPRINRFGNYRAQIGMLEGRLFDVYKVLKQTNPSLLLLINKHIK